MTTLITIGNGTLPVGFCPTNWQNLLDNFVQQMFASFNGSEANGFYNYGDTAPDPVNSAFPWLRISNVSAEKNGWYTYSSGYWRRAHPEAPNSNVRRLWRGPEADLWSYDGGDGTDPAVPGNVQPHTGAMWKLDTDFTGRSPMGVGTVPGTAAPKTLALDEQYGAGEHALTIAEMPAHSHSVKARTSVDINAGARTVHMQGDDEGGLPAANTTRDTTNTGGGAVIGLVHPVLGIRFAKRTARVYYTA